jgi:hypothetical protein
MSASGMEDGMGSLFRRRYRVRIGGPSMSGGPRLGWSYQF